MGFDRAQRQTRGGTNLTMTHALAIGKYHAKPLDRLKICQRFFQIYLGRRIAIVTSGLRSRCIRILNR
jgi:hypothetical protein